MANNGHGGFTAHRVMELRELTFKPADVVICSCGNEVEARPMMKGVCYSCYREQMDIRNETISEVAPMLIALKDAVESVYHNTEQPTLAEAVAGEIAEDDKWLGSRTDAELADLDEWQADCKQTYDDLRAGM